MPVDVVRGARPGGGRRDPGERAGVVRDAPRPTRRYVADAGRLPSYLAVDGDEVVGRRARSRSTSRSRASCTCSPYAVTGTAKGIGRALVEAVESDLRAAGVRLLEVHTVGPSRESEGYARTREFYLATGFVAMNELQRIDWNGPTLILVKPL